MSNRNHLTERRSKYSRRTNIYEPRKRILIVCEGEKTEPNYFLRFPIPQDSVVVIRGIGANTISLVRETIKLMSKSEYDQVWCVFDRDSFPPNNFCSAIQMAEANGVKVAYSNEAFELWYVLHFTYLTTGISREQYFKILERELGCYQKNSKQMYDLIYSHQKDAIRNAQRLLQEYQICNPLTSNPSTTVHLLVEELNRIFWKE